MKSYKQLHSFEEREKEASSILAKYEDRVPIILEKCPTSTSTIPEIDKNKFLVPKELNMSQFCHVVRKRMKLPPEQALFFFINNAIISGSKSIGKLYSELADKDGFLYIVFSSENTFGY
jgi:GABA(A) receptor-associated protein